MRFVAYQLNGSTGWVSADAWTLRQPLASAAYAWLVRANWLPLVSHQVHARFGGGIPYGTGLHPQIQIPNACPDNKRVTTLSYTIETI